MSIKDYTFVPESAGSRLKLNKMKTYTFQFTKSENMKIQSKLVKGTSKENAVIKFNKKTPLRSGINLIKVYEN